MNNAAYSLLIRIEKAIENLSTDEGIIELIFDQLKVTQFNFDETLIQRASEHMAIQSPLIALDFMHQAYQHDLTRNRFGSLDEHFRRAERALNKDNEDGWREFERLIREIGFVASYCPESLIRKSGAPEDECADTINIFSDPTDARQPSFWFKVTRKNAFVVFEYRIGSGEPIRTVKSRAQTRLIEALRGLKALSH